MIGRATRRQPAISSYPELGSTLCVGPHVATLCVVGYTDAVKPPVENPFLNMPLASEKGEIYIGPLSSGGTWELRQSKLAMPKLLKQIKRVLDVYALTVADEGDPDAE